MSRISRLIVSMFVDNIKVINIKRSGYTEKIKQKLTTTFIIVEILPNSFYLELKVKKNQ